MLVAGSVAIISLLVNVHWVALFSVSAMVLVAPIARLLASRVLLWAVGALAAASVTAGLAWIPFNSVTVVFLIAVGMLASVVATATVPRASWRPRLPLADGVVIVGATLLLLMLVAPTLWASPDDLLLDLARGYDQLNHFAVFSNILNEQGFEWVTGDGSAAVVSGYPMGVHTMGAIGNLLGPRDAREDMLLAFAWTSAIAVAFSAMALGWIALRIAYCTGPVRNAAQRGLLAAVIWTIFALLGGAFAGVFEVGHFSFLLPAVLGIAASWMAVTNRRQRPGQAMLLIALAALGLGGSYPPLVAGLMPAAIAIVVAHSVTRRPGVVLLGAALAAVSVLLLWRYRSSFQFVATASGECSTPVITAITMSAVTLSLVLVAQSRRYGAPLKGLAVAAGYAGAALVIAVFSIALGFPALSNYYVAKLMQATWWAELPVIVAVSAWAITRALKVRAARVRVPALIACAMAVSLLLALVPDGRYLGFGGPALLSHRLKEMDRARGLVQVVAASMIRQPGADVSAVLVEPGGWFLPVAADETVPDPPVRTGSLASQWLSELRGVRSATQEEAALCMKGAADESALPCLERWLVAHDTPRLAVVLEAGGSYALWEEFQVRHPGRVEIVILPPSGQIGSES